MEGIGEWVGFGRKQSNQAFLARIDRWVSEAVKSIKSEEVTSAFARHANPVQTPPLVLVVDCPLVLDDQCFEDRDVAS